MTVEDLTAFFSSLPPDTELFISQDPEGNGFNRIDYDVDTVVTLNVTKGIVFYPIDRGIDWDELFKKQN